MYLEGPNQGGGVPRLGVASVGKVRQDQRNQGGGRGFVFYIHKGACLCDFPACLAVGVVVSRPGGWFYFLPAYGKNIFCPGVEAFGFMLYCVRWQVGGVPLARARVPRMRYRTSAETVCMMRGAAAADSGK